MANETILAQIQLRMEVRSADGIRLGQIREVWYGSDPLESGGRCDEEVCSRLEVRHSDGTIYIPYNAIAGVSGPVVTLKLDAAAVKEKNWYHPPGWIANSALDPAVLAKVGAPHLIG
jgi:hypothetical protein